MPRILIDRKRQNNREVTDDGKGMRISAEGKRVLCCDC